MYRLLRKKVNKIAIPDVECYRILKLLKIACAMHMNNKKEIIMDFNTIDH